MQVDWGFYWWFSWNKMWPIFCLIFTGFICFIRDSDISLSLSFSYHHYPYFLRVVNRINSIMECLFPAFVFASYLSISSTTNPSSVLKFISDKLCTCLLLFLSFFNLPFLLDAIRCISLLAFICLSPWWCELFLLAKCLFWHMVQMALCMPWVRVHLWLVKNVTLFSFLKLAYIFDFVCSLNFNCIIDFDFNIIYKC